jgi:uncharacterized protein (TIGR02145 family)
MKKIRLVLLLIFVLLASTVTDSCKKDATLPTLTTKSITAITINSATSGGDITSAGGADITAKGVCYGTERSPSVSGTSTNDGTGTGTFTSDMTGLTPNTLYYVRAYATNKVGTAYGSEVSFTTTAIVVPTLTTTAVTDVTLTTAVSGGNITADGGGAVTARGVCWATTTGPTISNSLTSDGTGTGTFVSNLSQLQPSTTYYVRAYATNSAGTSYGSEVSFTTTAIVVPTLTTAQIASVTLTSAVSGGNITSDGGGAITAKGVCYSTTTGPTVDGLKTSDGTGSDSYESNILSLSPGVKYYVRAYATNSAGTAYGDELSFTTTAIVVPTITTTAISAVGSTTATSGGNITSDGGGTVTVSGICWATTANPTTLGSKTTDGTLTGSFTSNLTGLTPGTTYHVRAYATNSAGTGYGSDLILMTIAPPTLTTTAITGITATGATSGGNITANGGSTITVSGICWGTTANPTTAGSKTTDGAVTGSYVSNLTGLTPGTTYHVRAYATNAAGTGYGADAYFTTVSPPTISTNTVTAITSTTATSGGNITSNGGGTVSVSGICWGTSANPTTAGSKTTDGTLTGSFSSNITGLTTGTTYHVRAYATNIAGTAYGSDLQFITLSIPVLTTTSVTSIAATSAVSGGTITSNGGTAVTVSGICWSTSADPDITGSKTTNGTLTGSFPGTLTGLTPSTTYHVRAYATNSVGTGYGADVQFATIALSAPTLTTALVTSVTTTSAVSGGTITATGGDAITVSGICWSTSSGPTISGSHTTDGTLTGTFTSNLTGLTPGTVYYVRAYATNSSLTGYGTEIILSTQLADNDAHTYNTIYIQGQLWMAENLQTSKYNDGTAIPAVTGTGTEATWAALATDAYCDYNNDPSNSLVYGKLYNWFVASSANTHNVCPTGWHVATDTDFDLLATNLGGSSVAGGPMKATTLWATSGTPGTNTSGFTGLPGGFRTEAGAAVSMTLTGPYWTSNPNLSQSTEGIGYGLHYNDLALTRAGFVKQIGCGIRCVK